MRDFKAKGVFAAVSHIQESVLVFLLVVELAHGQTATQQKARLRERRAPSVPLQRAPFSLEIIKSAH